MVGRGGPEGYRPDQGGSTWRARKDRVVGGLRAVAQVAQREVSAVPGALKMVGAGAVAAATVVAFEASPLMARKNSTEGHEKPRDPKAEVQALRLPSGRTMTRGSGGETVVKDEDGRTVGYDAGRDA